MWICLFLIQVIFIAACCSINTYRNTTGHCPSLFGLIPNSLLIPVDNFLCRVSPRNFSSPIEDSFTWDSLQPFGCEIRVVCLPVAVASPHGSRVLRCSKNGSWTPTEKEVARGRSLFPQCNQRRPVELSSGASASGDAATSFSAKKQQSGTVLAATYSSDADESGLLLNNRQMLSRDRLWSLLDAANHDLVNFDECPAFSASPSSPWTVVYKKQRLEGPISAGDRAQFSCKNNIRVENADQMCLADGTWSGSGEPVCAPIGCVLPSVNRNTDDHLLVVYENCNQDGSNGLQTCHVDDSQLVAPGVKVFFKCRDPLNYYLEGEVLFTCGFNSKWIPHNLPYCRTKLKCPRPLPVAHGYFYYETEVPQFFDPGHRLQFFCDRGYVLSAAESHWSELLCLGDGQWSHKEPRACVPADYISNRFITIASISGLLGLLLLVMAVFFVQRHLLIRKTRDIQRRLVAPPVGVDPQTAAHGIAPSSDLDRLALIAFADEFNVPLPSYEDAVGEAAGGCQQRSRSNPPQWDAISSLSGYTNRMMRRLPSLYSLRSRDTVQPVQLREGDDLSSNQSVAGSGSNLAAERQAVGSSFETVTVSDISTAFSADSSCTSRVSATAQAGSLDRSESNLQMNNDEDSPLLSEAQYSAEGDSYVYQSEVTSEEPCFSGGR